MDDDDDKLGGSDEKGRELCDKAVKRLNSFAIFNKQAKFEDAKELFCAAAVQFKLTRNFVAAADAYVQAAECCLKLDSAFEADNLYVQAAKCCKNSSEKSGLQDAIRYLKIVSKSQLSNNKFSSAAKTMKEIAEIYESLDEFSNAVAAYEDAAKYYQAEDSPTTANQCLLKVADIISVKMEDFRRAAQLYEKVAIDSMDNTLTKWSVKDYFFKALLCQLAVLDASGTRLALDKYKDLNVQFGGSRECKFIEAITEAFAENDIDKFTDVVYEFDNISKLDNWKSKILLTVKLGMKKAQEQPDNPDDVPDLS